MPRVSDQVVIVGAGETKVGKLPGMQSVHIQAWAVQQALVDCGLRVNELDGLINLDPYAVPHSMFSSTLSEYLGLKPKFLSTLDVGGTVTGMTMLQQAVWAIEAGHCEVVACVYGENALTARAPEQRGLAMQNLMGGQEWEEPFGVHGMVTPYALVAQRYLHQYGATVDDFGEVSVLTRRHALNNENAQMKKPMTLEDHRASKMISSPLRLLDCSLVSDGGGAVILTTRSRAQRMGQPFVSIKSMAMRATHSSIAQLPDLENFGMREAGRDAFEAAGEGPEAMQVALLHDAFSVSVLITLEALGFCQLAPPHRNKQHTLTPRPGTESAVQESHRKSFLAISEKTTALAALEFWGPSRALARSSSMAWNLRMTATPPWKPMAAPPPWKN